MVRYYNISRNYIFCIELLEQENIYKKQEV